MYLANSNARAVVALDALLKRPDLNSLLAVLNEAGEEARIIGGAVRDCLMGRVVGDIDIATTAVPEVVVKRVTGMGWKAVPTGIAHGTVTVVINSVPYEVTTLRSDIATDGRHATVAFTRDFAEDARRRDFTINAMSVAMDSVLHDYGTGRDDARVGSIRFMGDPQTRIKEDYLRILRFFRFHASHGEGEPEAGALAACHALKQGLTQLSRERIRQEIFKLLMAPAAARVAAIMEKAGIWSVLFPGFETQVATLENLVMLESVFAEHATSPVRRLFALLSPALHQAGRLTELLRLSRREETQLGHILKHSSQYDQAIPEVAVFARTYLSVGAEASVDALLVALARNGATSWQARSWYDVAAPVLLRKPVMPFRNVDFDALGIAPGPARGELIQEATERWIAVGMPAEKPVQKALLVAVASDLKPS